MQSDIIPSPPVEPNRGYSVAHATLYLDASAPGIYLLLRKNLLASRKIGDTKAAS